MRSRHVHNSLVLATYWPFIIELIGLAELQFFFGRIIESDYRLRMVLALAILVMPLGDFYFSPQSVGFVLALGVYGTVLRRDRSDITERLGLVLLTVAGCALALTHELSPFIVGGVLVVLVVFRVADGQ